jgi:hypothetical protein
MTMTIKGKESPLKIDITGKSFGKWTVLKYARFEQGTARAAPCCKTCNLAKRTMTLSQFNEWLDRILKFRTNLKEAALQPEEINAIPDYSI